MSVALLEKCGRAYLDPCDSPGNCLGTYADYQHQSLRGIGCCVVVAVALHSNAKTTR